MADGATLDQELGQLLEQETFPPPDEFRERAVVLGPVDLRRGRGGPRGLLGRAGRRRCTGSSTGTRCSTGRTRRSPSGSSAGKLNVSYNCLDRHVEAGRATASPSTGAARRARSATSPTRELHADVQRFANALKDRGIGAGRRRRDLPADDPRGRRRDARLRAHRRGPQRRLRRLLARVGARADGVLRGQGADHRRRRPAQGQDRADQGSGRRGRCPTCRASSCATPAPTRRWRTRTPGSTS